MRRCATKPLLLVGAAVLVVLLARTTAYALSPSPAARLLEQRAGGPALPLVALVSLMLAVSVALVICWLAALGVRERALLERRVLAGPAPRFDVSRTLALALALSIATSIAGGLLEAYVHWRAGLGWHGLQCIIGPVHRDLLPIECGFSLVAAAIASAAEHVGAWVRRTFALLRALPPRLSGLSAVLPPVLPDTPRPTLRFAAGSPRAPPALS
jgi:hypothetical protein